MPFFAAPPPAITLTIDAREVSSKQVIHVKLRFPAKPGPLTLEYPKWIPGMHEPVGPVQNVVRLGFLASGKSVAWRRDGYDSYAFQLTVPAGAKELEAHFDYLPRQGDTDEIAYGVAATANLAVINPSALFLAPRGADIRTTQLAPTLLLPDGWQKATSLPSTPTVSLERLADSPIFAGKYLKRFELPSPDGVSHTLAVIADSDEGATPNAHVLACMKRLVTESAALFGARHYDKFNFLLALTTGLPQYGLEHHESTVNVLRPSALGDGTGVPGQWNANLLPHEYVHSWNGKFRRPYGLAGKTFNQPLSTDLLWVYEGMTEYLGEILMVRCGFYPFEAEREHLRQTLLSLDGREARKWQSLREAALAYPLIASKGDGKRLRLSNDVYYESMLHWLEADALIRQKSNEKLSLDDFCRRFFGGINRGPEVKPYTEDELVAALKATLPAYNWAEWLHSRFDSLDTRAPRLGLELSGWPERLGEVHDPKRERETLTDFRSSLGFRVQEGKLVAIEPDSFAAQAGLSVGNTLTLLNGQPFTSTLLRDTIRASKTQATVLNFQVDGVRSVKFDYLGGERLSLLERVKETPDRLSGIFMKKNLIYP
jgi:predicted metalloprotease with PDZ domain